MKRNRAVTILIAACAVILAGACSGEAVSLKPETESSQRQEAQETSEPAAGKTEEKDTDRYVSLWAGAMTPGIQDGDAEQAQFIKPYGLCEAPDGGLLVVDSYANRLRTVKDSQVATLAGNAEVFDQGGYPLGGYLNGKAADAFLNRPRFAVCSQEGAVVFSDTENHRIRILYEGTVRLLAGTGEAGFSDGRYDTACFNTPAGVAIGENGTVYVADTLNHCIRQITGDGQVSTLAGIPGEAGWKDGPEKEALFCEPNDIQLGTDGALYVVDKGNQRIRRVAQGEVTTVAGSGAAKDSVTGYIIGGYRDGASGQAQFQYPTGLCIAPDATIYVADTGNNCIRSIAADGTVATVSGTKMSGNVNGPVNQARFNQPLDVYYSEGGLYVSDSYNHVIRLIDLEGKGGDSQ